MLCLVIKYNQITSPQSVSVEEVAGVDLVPDVIEAGGVAVGDDGLGEALELLQVVDDPAAEERAAVREGRLVDDDGGALGPDALHHALDAALAEVVAARLHRQAVHPDDHVPLP